MNTDTVFILAIDRAEKHLAIAIDDFSRTIGKRVECYLLVSNSYKASPAYKGNELPGIFEEIIVDFDDKKSLNKTVRDLFGRSKVVIHCRMEEAIKDLEKIIPFLDNCLVPSVESLEISTQKSKMRNVLQKKYPEITTQYKIVSTLDNLDESEFDEFKFPVIIKPNGLHSSYLVEKCVDIHELMKKLHMAFEKIESIYGREYGTGTISMLIEELIVGTMYSMDSYVDENSLSYHLPPIRVIPSAEVGRDGFYCYRTKTSIPELSEHDIEEAKKCVSKCIDAVGLTTATTHTELYNTKDGWKIIEIAPRIGGNRQALYGCAYGIDHYYNDLLIHYGSKPNMALKKLGFAGGFNIYADMEGTITSISGLDEARKLESAFRLDLNTKVGDKSVFASNGGVYIADGVFYNPDEDKLEKDIAQMRDILQFKVV